MGARYTGSSSGRRVQRLGVSSARSRDFRQYIATRLSREHGFVVWHIDADVPYRNHGEFDKESLFNDRIRQPIRALLRWQGQSSEEIEQHLDKLLLLVPYYNIEAWCFQNTERAVQYCPGDPRCRKNCRTKLATWSTDRGQLDEVSKPQDELCFESKYNAELASDEKYPLVQVLEAEKSLRDALNTLRACQPLVDALEQIKPAWQR